MVPGTTTCGKTARVSSDWTTLPRRNGVHWTILARRSPTTNRSLVQVAVAARRKACYGAGGDHREAQQQRRASLRLRRKPRTRTKSGNLHLNITMSKANWTAPLSVGVALRSAGPGRREGPKRRGVVMARHRTRTRRMRTRPKTNRKSSRRGGDVRSATPSAVTKTRADTKELSIRSTVVSRKITSMTLWLSIDSLATVRENWKNETAKLRTMRV